MPLYRVFVATREGCHMPDKIVDYLAVPTDQVLDYLNKGYELRVNIGLGAG